MSATAAEARGELHRAAVEYECGLRALEQRKRAQRPQSSLTAAGEPVGGGSGDGDEAAAADRSITAACAAAATALEGTKLLSPNSTDRSPFRSLALALSLSGSRSGRSAGFLLSS